MFELAKIPFPEVDRLAKSGCALVILPVGVVEEHGAHLPLGVDSFTAEAYAASTAPHLEEAGYEVVVAPTINYGVARAAIDFPGTLSLEPETLRSMVVEIGRSLLRHGLGRLVILNGHRDKHHMKALDDAKNILVEEKSAQTLLVGFAHDDEITAACYREGVKQFYKSPRPDREGHGGESETSLALHNSTQTSITTWKLFAMKLKITGVSAAGVATSAGPTPRQQRLASSSSPFVAETSPK